MKMKTKTVAYAFSKRLPRGLGRVINLKVAHGVDPEDQIRFARQARFLEAYDPDKRRHWVAIVLGHEEWDFIKTSGGKWRFREYYVAPSRAHLRIPLHKWTKLCVRQVS